MAKARVTWTFGETPATSDKLNDAVQDYIRKGQLILSSTGAVIRVTTTGGVLTFPHTAGTPWQLGWYPYNPAKQIYDRMDILFNHGVAGTATDLHLQYSLNSGGSWTSANPGQSVSPLSLITPLIIAAGTSLGPSTRTVDLSGMAGFEYIGFRYLPDVTEEAISWIAMAFMYLSTDTPF